MTKIKSWFITRSLTGYRMNGAIFGSKKIKDGELITTSDIRKAGITYDKRYLVIEVDNDIIACYLKQAHPCNNDDVIANAFARFHLTNADSRVFMQALASIALVRSAQIKLCASRLGNGEFAISLNATRESFFDYAVYKKDKNSYCVLHVEKSDNPFTVKLTDRDGNISLYYNIDGDNCIGISPTEKMHFVNSGPIPLKLITYTPSAVNLDLMEQCTIENMYLT